jgi:hypothetical protein
MRWQRHVARMGDMRNAYKNLFGKPEGKRSLISEVVFIIGVVQYQRSSLTCILSFNVTCLLIFHKSEPDNFITVMNDLSKLTGIEL